MPKKLITKWLRLETSAGIAAHFRFEIIPDAGDRQRTEVIRNWEATDVARVLTNYRPASGLDSLVKTRIGGSHWPIDGFASRHPLNESKARC